MTKSKVKYAALCGIAGPMVLFAAVATAALLSPHFDPWHSTLSELGSVEANRWSSDGGAATTETALVFNTGVVLGAILNIIFVLGLARFYSRNRPPSARLGVKFMLVGFVGLFLVGVVPMHIVLPHYIAAFSFFTLTPVAMYLIGGAELDAGRGIKGGLYVAAGLSAVLIIMIAYEAVGEVASGGLILLWSMHLAHGMYRDAGEDED